MLALANSLSAVGMEYQVITVPVGPLSLRQNLEILRGMSKIKPGDWQGDLILSTGTLFWGALSGALGRRIGIPTLHYLNSQTDIYSPWHAWWELNLLNFKYGKGKFFRNVFDSRVYLYGFGPDLFKLSKRILCRVRKCSRLVASSCFLRDKAARFYDWAIPVIPPGIDLTDIPDLSTNMDRRSLLYLGAADPRRGLLDLIRCYDHLKKKHSDLKLVLQAWPDYLSTARNLAEAIIRRHRIEDVTFAGFAENLTDCYRSGALVCLPYQFTNFIPPLVLLETMAHGRPAAVAAVGANLEYIQDGVSGFVTQPFDHKAQAKKIQFILEDYSSGQLIEIGKKAREIIVEKCRWDQFCEQMSEQIRLAVEEKK